MTPDNPATMLFETGSRPSDPNSPPERPDIPAAYTSLSQLQDGHARLVKYIVRTGLTPENIDLVGKYVRAGIATGTVLDAVADRTAAQSLITYWTTRLRAAGRESGKDRAGAEIPDLEDTLLAEFKTDALVGAVVKPTESWLAGLTPSDRVLVRRLILRLLYLRPDGEFDVLPSAPGISEGLVPQEQADRLLKDLVRLGAVRKARDPGGNVEYALPSKKLLELWPSLKAWMDSRRQFRQKAVDWSQRGAERAARPANRSFLRRAERAFGKTVQTVGGWIEARWSALLVRLNLRKVSPAFLTEEEYEEAETYRDKSAPEFRLVYQKRHMDKEREERRQIRAAAIAFIALVFGVLSAVTFSLWVAEGVARRNAQRAEEVARLAEDEAVKARQQADDAKKHARLDIASWELERGAQHQRAGDTSGALLYYAAAWSEFVAHGDCLPAADRDRQLASHLLRLGAAHRQLPHLSAVAFQNNGPPDSARPLAVASANGEVALGVGIEGSKEKPILVVRVWRAAADAGWAEQVVRQPLPADAFAPARGVNPYVSPDGGAAVVMIGRDQDGDLHPLSLSPGTAPNWHPKLPYQGTLVDARFSPDGRYFGAVTARSEPGDTGRAQKKSTVAVWEVDGWKSHPLAMAVLDGTAGGLAFAAPAVGPARAAVVLGSDAPAPGPLCLEWELGSPATLKQPKRFNFTSPDSPSAKGDEILFAAYGAPDQSLLLAARGVEENNIGSAWVFDVRRPAEPPLFRVNHLKPINCADFNPHGDRLVTASGDGEVRCWRLVPEVKGRTSAHLAPRIERHGGQVFQVRFSPDGRYVVTASRDKRALVLDAATGAPVLPPIDHSGSVGQAEFTRDGRRVTTVCQSAAYRWDLPWADSRPLLIGLPRDGVSRALRTESLDRDGRVLTAGGAAGAGRGWARAWDTATGAPLTPELSHDTPVRHVAVSPRDDLLVCTTAEDGTLRLWDRQGRSIWDEPACADKAIATAFGDNGRQLRLLVLARESPTLMSGHTSLRIYTIERADGPIAGGPGGADVRVAFFKGTEFEDTLTAAVFSPNADQVVAYAGDLGDGRGLAFVWDLDSPTAHRLAQPDSQVAHLEPITHAAFSKDGRRVVTASRDDTATVWVRGPAGWARHELRGDVDRKELIARHTADVLYVAFDETGTRVVTASADGSALVWEHVEAENRYRPVSQLRSETRTGGILRAEFIDTRLVLTAGTDGTVGVWDTTGMRRLVAGRASIPAIRAVTYRPPRPPAAGQVVIVGMDWGRQVASPSGAPSTRPAGQFTITEWPLSPLDESATAEIMSVAELAAARRVSPADSVQTSPLPQDELVGQWAKTRLLLTRAAPTPDDLLAWHLREVNACELAGEWAGALWHLNEILKEENVRERHRLLGRRARVRGELRDWDGAEQDYAEALKGHETDKHLLRDRAETRMRHAEADADMEVRRARYHGAIEDYRQVLALDEHDRPVRVALANAHVQAGDHSSAVAEYDRLLAAAVDDPDLLRRRAHVLQDLGTQHLNRAYADFLAASRLYRVRQQWNEADGTYHAAIALIGKGAKVSDQEQARVRFELGEIQLTRGERTYDGTRDGIYRDARDQFRRATELDPTAGSYWGGLARAHERLREWQEARAALDKAIDKNPDDLSLAVSRADCLIQLLEWQEAAKALRAIIDRDRKTLTYRFWLAAVCLQPAEPGGDIPAERVEEARQCLVSAAQDFPDDAVCWSRLAVLQLRAGKVEEYRAIRTRVLDQFQDPKGEAANSVAWIAALADDRPPGIERARELIAKAVAAFPQNARYWSTYGAVLFRAGEPGQAKEQFDKAAQVRARTYLGSEESVFGSALDLLFLAMIEHGAQQTDNARRMLDSSVQSLEQFKPAPQGMTTDQILRTAWRRLEYDVIRREAEKRIRP